MVEKVTVNISSGSVSVRWRGDRRTYDGDHDKPIIPPEIPCQPCPGVHAKNKEEERKRAQDPSIRKKECASVDIPADGFRRLAGHGYESGEPFHREPCCVRSNPIDRRRRRRSKNRRSTAREWSSEGKMDRRRMIGGKCVTDAVSYREGDLMRIMMREVVPLPSR